MVRNIMLASIMTTLKSKDLQNNPIIYGNTRNAIKDAQIYNNTHRIFKAWAFM